MSRGKRFTSEQIIKLLREVEINLYDKEGVQIGSTLANANHLEPNGKWRFKAVVLEGSAATAKLKGVTAF